jgi:hypothetical protein
MLRNIRKNIVRTAALATVAIGGLGLVNGPAAWAQGAQTGVATIQCVNGTATCAPGGQSGTAANQNFKLILPANADGTAASCLGDTAGGGFHVWSYAVPIASQGGTNPGELTFPGTPTAVTLLTDTGSIGYGPVNTNPASTAGGPGQINTLPTFSWAPYIGSFGASAADGLPLWTGDWNIGIACAGPNGSGAVSTFWLATVTLGAANPVSGDFSWTVDPPQSIPESPWAVALPLSAIAVVGAGLFALRRRRRGQSAAAA